MSKPAVTKLFVAGFIAFVAGVVLAAVAAFGAIASGSITIGGSAIVRIDGAGLGPAIGLFTIAGLIVLAGMVMGVVAWIGALLNTLQLEDKTWFVILLVLGLWNFGFIAMVAYVVAGPDAMRPRPVVPSAGVAAPSGG